MISSAVETGPSVAAATWLGPQLLALLVQIDGQPAGRWRARVAGDGDGANSDASARWLASPARPGMPGTWLLTVGSDHLAADAPPDLVLEDGARRTELAGHAITASLCGAAGFAQACGAALDVSARARAAEFLAAAPNAHELTDARSASAQLVAVRDVLRPALPVSKVAPGVPFSMRLEQVIRVDESAFWLVGWLHAERPARARFAAVSPEGARAIPRDGAVTFNVRPEVWRAFGDDGLVTLGFSAYVELPSPSRNPSGWVLEARDDDGTAVQDTVRHPVIDDPEALQRQLLLERVTELDDDVLANQILPAVTRRFARADAGRIEAIHEYGLLPTAPDVSIVIATPHVDRLEHQILAFARDPQLAGVEVIFTIARGEDSELGPLIDELSSLHRLPVRIVSVSAGAGRARALNLGAAVASGRLLVLLSGDVIPTASGWLSVLRDFHEAHPDAGAIGPRLLHEDGSIASAGHSYVRARGAGGWMRYSPLRGLAPDLPAAVEARPVQALSSDWMLVAADRFRTSGGLCERYLEDGEESGDLCLALAEAGLRNWYVPQAELYVLEREPWPRHSGPVASTFNAWLLERRWGGRLADDAQSAEPPAERRRSRPAPAVTPVNGASARPGSPVEIVEVIPAELDGQFVFEAGLEGPDWTVPAYEHTYALAIEGWAIARDGLPATVELSADSIRPRRTRASRKRPDIASRYPDLPGADRSGFAVVLGSLGLPREFEIEVAVVNDRGRAPLGRVRGRRRPVRSTYDPVIAPLMVTTLGRTGSSWFVTLLSRHLQVIAGHPFRLEAALASYWMGVLQSVAEPASVMQALVPQRYAGPWWLGEQRPGPLPLSVFDNQDARWLGGPNVEAVASFCQSQCDAFYQQLARREGRSMPRYFVEKCFPDAAPRLVGELYPEGREIFLVRDFRDRIGSILGFNAKRGFDMFGRSQNTTDEEWFQWLRGEALALLGAWRERRDHAYLVRYEDLITNPEQTLAACFDHLELESDPGTVRRVLEMAAQTAPQSQASHLTAPSVSASVGRWKGELTPERREACAEAFDDVLVEFGYEPTASG